MSKSLDPRIPVVLAFIIAVAAVASFALVPELRSPLLLLIVVTALLGLALTIALYQGRR